MKAASAINISVAARTDRENVFPVSDSASKSRSLARGELACACLAGDVRECAAPVVGTAVGVAPRDGARVAHVDRPTRGEEHARHEIRQRRIGKDLGRRCDAAGPRGHTQVFDGAADADVHLAKKRIDRAERSRPIDEDIDAVFADAELPGLAVVRVRGEHGGLHEREGADEGRELVPRAVRLSIDGQEAHPARS
jgi:hypothetical protein